VDLWPKFPRHCSSPALDVGVSPNNVQNDIILLICKKSVYRVLHKKVIPGGKFCISGIVADFFTKFMQFTDEDSGRNATYLAKVY